MLLDDLKMKEARASLFRLERADPRPDYPMDTSTQVLRAAVLLLAHGLDEDRCLLLLSDWANVYPGQPWTDAELRRKIREAARYSLRSPLSPDKSLLAWQDDGFSSREALLGTPEDGVRFSLQHMPTCYRRGPWRLLIEVLPGDAHFLWGCFDNADQPDRWYHAQEHALAEAELIAAVLLADRRKATMGEPS